MATVRHLIDELVRGRTTLENVRKDFETRTWPPVPELTPEQAAGVVDTPLPPADSIDWVDIHGRLTQFQRRVLRQAYDRAQAASPRTSG